MKSILCFFVLIHFFTSILFSQVNTEKYRPDSDTTGFSFNGQIDFSLQSGNVDVKELEAESNLSYRDKGYVIYLVGIGEAGWESGRRYSNNSLVHLRYINILSQKLKLEVFTQADYARERLLDWRGLAGGGLRYLISNSDNFNLSMGVGAMYEKEKYKLPDSAKHPRETSDIRISSYINTKNKFNEYIQLSIVAYFQPVADDFQDIKILTEAAFNFKINNMFSLVLELQTRFDEKPPDTIKRWDLKSAAGLAISL